jgi:hypothetical protein
MDYLFEIFVEFFGELYMELMFLIVPEKYINKKFRPIAATIAIVGLEGVIALVIWGFSLVDRGHNWGAFLIAAGVIISLAQIITGILLYKKNH